MKGHSFLAFVASVLFTTSLAAANAIDDGVERNVFSTPDFWPLLSTHSNEIDQLTSDRELAVGGFHDLEVVYQHATISDLPNQTLTGAINGKNWTVDIKLLQCQNLTIGDLELSYVLEGVQFLGMNLSSLKFDFNCFMDYQFNYLRTGSGRIDGSTASASALLTSAFVSPNFTMNGPADFFVETCNASVDFTTLNFLGQGIGSVTALQSAVEPQLLEIFKVQSEMFVCQALNTLNFTILELLQNVSNFLGPDLNSTMSSGSSEVQAVMSAEASLPTNASNVTLLSFAHPHGTLSSVINFLVQEVTSYLASYANATDLNINDVMRSYILNNDGALSLNASFLYNVFDGAFFSGGGGYFSQSYLVPENLQVMGLDTFTSFSPFQAVGEHTLQTNFSLDSLSLLVSMVWELPDGSVENVTLEIDTNQVNATVDLLVAIDLDLLGALPLGSLLNSSDLLNCIFSAFYDVQISDLTIVVGEINAPKVGGFGNSPGSKLIASKFMSAVYDMFHYVVLDALPGFFQTTGRGLLSNLTGTLLNKTVCPNSTVSTSANGLIDLRDFFLPPSTAKTMGGSGTSPYGDVANSIKGIIDSLLVDNSTGSPGINNILIGPLTQQKSGTPGALTNLFHVDQKLNAENSLSARIRIKINDVNVDNIAISDPFFLLDPVPNDPYLINNTVTIGVNDTTPVQLRADVFFHWDGDGELQHSWIECRLAESV